MSISRRRLLVLMPAAAATLIAACAGEEDAAGRRSAGANTPLVVRNSTPVPLGSPNPAAIAATAAAQAAGAPAKGEPKPDAKPGTRLGIVQPSWETIRLREQELSGQLRTVNT